MMPAGCSTTPEPRAGRLAGLRTTRAMARFASFSDPDGNGWLIQEITARLPGR